MPRRQPRCCKYEVNGDPCPFGCVSAQGLFCCHKNARHQKYPMRHRPCTWGARCKYRHDVPVPEGPPQVVHVECNVHMLPLKRKNPFEHGKNTAHGEGMMTAAEGERAASSTVEQDSEDGERYVPMTYNFVEQLCRARNLLPAKSERTDAWAKSVGYQSYKHFLKSQCVGIGETSINKSRPRTDSEASNGESKAECVVCLEKNADTAVIPCGHMCGCGDCLLRISKSANPQCPLCRGPMTSVIRIYQVS